MQLDACVRAYFCRGATRAHLSVCSYKNQCGGMHGVNFRSVGAPAVQPYAVWKRAERIHMQDSGLEDCLARMHLHAL
eukprot:364053-Chlamydomonas_euryale.AAC.8